MLFRSVIVMGLDRWDRAQCRELTEARLLRKVQRELGAQVESLRLPPMPAADAHQFTPPLESTRELGVPVALFPRYMKCPACSFLAPFNCGVFSFKPDLHRVERTRVEHSTCHRSPKKSPTVVPARFLVVCEDGHLDDFP